MGKNANIKELRGQIRQIVKEILPEVLTTELFQEVTKLVVSRIKEIEDSTKDTMSDMNNRHKETMGYLIRQVSSPPPPLPTSDTPKQD